MAQAPPATTISALTTPVSMIGSSSGPKRTLNARPTNPTNSTIYSWDSSSSDFSTFFLAGLGAGSSPSSSSADFPAVVGPSSTTATPTHTARYWSIPDDTM